MKELFKIIKSKKFILLLLLIIVVISACQPNKENVPESVNEEKVDETSAQPDSTIENRREILDELGCKENLLDSYPLVSKESKEKLDECLVLNPPSECNFYWIDYEIESGNVNLNMCEELRDTDWENYFNCYWASAVKKSDPCICDALTDGYEKRDLKEGCWLKYGQFIGDEIVCDLIVNEDGLKDKCIKELGSWKD
jgi:hypothetical protein